MFYAIGYDYDAEAEGSPCDEDPVSLIMLAVCSVVGIHTADSANKKNISGSGCVEKAAENSCRVVIDSQTGELYNLQFGARAPKSGTAITFSGRPPKGAPACKQGKLVTVSKWKEEKGIKCPPPVVMAQAGR